MILLQFTILSFLGIIMKTMYLTIGAMALLVCLFPVSVKADTQLGDFNVSGSAALLTDYVFRGVSQTDEGPTIQGGFKVAHTTGLYAGIFGANVDFNDGDEANIELDYYFGYANEYEGFSYDLGFIYYNYPGANDALDYDFVEFMGSLGYDLDIASLRGTINYSPDFFGSTGDAVYYAADVTVPLPYDVSFLGHAGYQTIDKGTDYPEWSLGLGYSIAGFDLSLKYHDTDLDEPSECADGCSARIVAGVSRNF